MKGENSMSTMQKDTNSTPKVISELPADYFLAYRQVVGSRLHTHTFFELEFYLNDSGVVTLNNDTYAIKRNGICISVPTDYHKLTSHNDEIIKIWNLSFTSNVLDKELQNKLLYYSQSNVYYLSDKDAEKVKTLINLIEQEQAEKQKNDNFAELCISSIITLVLRYRKDTPKEQKQSLALKVVQYVLEHFKENITLDIVAKEVGLNSSYLSHHFHKETGFKFKEYLIKTRINYAKKLIRANNEMITYACFESGFNSYSAFSRAFVDTVGCSPSDYAQKQNGNTTK